MAGMAFQNPNHHPWLLAFLALLTAFFSASQDTSIDAYRTDVLPDQLRGVGAAMTSLGYRLALLVSGAIALVMAYKIGWRTTYLMMSLLMLLSIFGTLYGPKITIRSHPPIRLKEAIFKPFIEFLSRPYAVLIIAFMITYKLSDALALALNTYFLLHFLKFSLMDLGVVTKVAGLMGVVMGGLIGGALYPSLGLYRSLLYFGVLQALSALLFALLTLVGKSYWLMAVSIFSENFCSGLSSVAFVVYLTALCDVNYTATQYALFSAIMSFGRVYIGPVAALLVKELGWFDFYILSFLAGFIPLGLLIWLHKKKNILVSY
jgi:PAT family beta-lactamase induction signal transducer AmpG